MMRLLLIIAFGFSSVMSVAQTDLSKSLENFNTLMYHIDRLYVDSVDAPNLIEQAMVKILEELDPHSVYIPSKERKKMEEPLVGNFEGVGIQFSILRDTIFVVATIAGGPSEKIGIRAGDKIIMVEKDTVAGIGVQNSDVMKYLRGKKGTIVDVKIKRRDLKEWLGFSITRDKIPLYSLDVSYMVTPEIGYVKLNRFSSTSVEEFVTAVEELKSKGMKNLILDLQGNGGGYLSAAVGLADELLSNDKLLVYTQGRYYPKETYKASKDGCFEYGKLAVLVDESSASASEIVSGAVQDWDRGLIIGRRTFGKGLVQRPYPLPDGAAVRLTVSRYYTPSGRSIQKSYEGGIDDYRMEKYERYKSGELASEDSISMPDSLKYFTSTHRTVYGGGGILPDVFAGIDTTKRSFYFNQLIRKGIIYQFGINYVDDERKKLIKDFKDIEGFVKGFEVDESILKSLASYAKKEGLVLGEVTLKEDNTLTDKEVEDLNNTEQERIENDRTLIALRLKALIARNIWNSAGFYQVIAPLNESLQKAIEAMQDDTFEKTKLTENEL
ncbi:MAG: carboxyl-terminal processing protease [Flavobacteriales bacterium]|jgi:carboxyl-terminal processing protease